MAKMRGENFTPLSQLDVHSSECPFSECQIAFRTPQVLSTARLDLPADNLCVLSLSQLSSEGGQQKENHPPSSRMSEDLSTQQGSPSLSEVLLPKSSVIVAPPAPTAAVSSANSSRRSSGTPIPIPSPPPPPPISSAALYKRHCSEELLPVGSRIKIIG